MAVIGGIDILWFTLGILFILKMIRQLVRVVGPSVDEPITRTLTRFLFLMGGHLESHSFPTFSIYCLY